MRSIGGSRDTTWLPGHGERQRLRRQRPPAGGARITARPPAARTARVGIAAALLAIGGLIGASFVKSPQQLAADTAAPPATVTTATVVSQVLTSSVQMRGVVYPATEYDVYPSAPDSDVSSTSAPASSSSSGSSSAATTACVAAGPRHRDEGHLRLSATITATKLPCERWSRRRGSARSRSPMASFSAGIAWGTL